MSLQKTAEISPENRKASRSAGLRLILAVMVLGSTLIAPETGAQAKPVWKRLFDGKDLSGWGYTADYWQVEDGTLQGQGKAFYNTFCHSDRKYSDFVLSVKARLWQTPAGYTNSGLQYRSDFIDSATHRMKGYQVDIGDALDGSMYPEGNFPADAKQLMNDPCRKFINPNGWNHFLVTANGGKVRHELNGNFCVEYTATVLDGYIGLQLHATSLVMKVDFKDIYIRPLNNSFAVPESLATTLDDTYAATSIVPITHTAAGSRVDLIGNSLSIPASFWSGNKGRIDVSLRDFRGRTVFSRPIKAEGGASLTIELPALAAGGHILSVTGTGNAYSGVLR